LSLTQRDPDTLADASVEHTLGPADGSALELRDRILLALRYTASWGRAAGNAVDNDGRAFADRIGDIEEALYGLLTLIPADSVFPGKDAAAAYERTSQAFAQLYRDLTFSAATLPDASLLDQAGSLLRAVVDAPSSALTMAAEATSNAVARALGGTAAAVWSALWPWLLLAGGVGVAYVFRAPLARALKKVSS
jgi:hypothetical protein